MIPGDIVLVQYKTKVTTVWKLGRVSQVFPDKHGVVRTCEVVFRPKQRGDRLLPYKGKPMYSLRTAVQRLCILLPVEEQGKPVVTTSGGAATDAQDAMEMDSTEAQGEDPEEGTCREPVSGSSEDWEKVCPREEIRSVFRLVCHIMENLHNE